jgi:hypothetical protein
MEGMMCTTSGILEEGFCPGLEEVERGIEELDRETQERLEQMDKDLDKIRSQVREFLAEKDPT